MADQPNQEGSENSTMDRGKEKVVAGILGILLGGLGIHHFYLGSKTTGIIYIAVTLGGGLFTCGLASSVMGLLGLVEGILLLTFDDEKFDRLYNQQKPDNMDFVFNHM